MNKKLSILLSAALAVGAATGAYAASQSYNPGEGVYASPHNINRIVSGGDAYDTGAGDGRVCAYCHTPHHAIQDVSIASYNPLWSHQVTTGDFKGYQSPTLTAATKAAATDPLVGPSRLCMSCHDGIVAIDQHYGGALKNVIKNTGDVFGGIDVGDAGGSTLTNDHPIGMDFDAVASNDANGGVYKGIYPATRAFTVAIAAAGDNGTGFAVVPDAANTSMWVAGQSKAAVNRTIGDLLWNDGAASGSKNYMTCASCHDVHNKENPEKYLLINMESKSQICLTCHNK
jgi:predicted CXXCH cytochrome family protein